MNHLTVWTFGLPSGARDAARQVGDLDAVASSGIDDGALIEWPSGKKSPHAGQLDELAGPRALGVSFWDLLFGMVFLFPRLTETLDASPERLWDSLVGLGIDNGFLEQVRARVVPGTSALCLLGAADVTRTVAELWSQRSGEPVDVTLDDEQQRALHQVFPRQGPPNRVSA